MKPGAVILTHNGLLFVIVVGILVVLGRTRTRVGAIPLFISVAGLLAIGTVGAIASPIAGFGKAQLLAWTAFTHVPILLLGEAYIFRQQGRPIAWGCVALATAVMAVGVDAFVIEPHWMAVDKTTITTPKVDGSIRIAVIADLQSDAPGRYERRVFRHVMAEEPDLILLAGDYIHQAEEDQYREAATTLNRLMREAELDAPLGLYAVRGNVDWPGRWQDIFTSLPVSVLDRSQTLEVGPVILTGLTLQDSADTSLSISRQDPFHIVLGHIPNFSMGEVEADLLVAGHTHGGQIRLPFIGPLMTLSQVPRGWASGVTEIAPGRTLIVSRGIGMEREQAPRMRFLCRPQLVIVDLVGVEAGARLGGLF